MEQNHREKGGFEYTVPSQESYPYQWFWDSCFHAIILSHFDIERAKKELRSLMSKQFASGLIPHVIYWELNDILQVDWGMEGTSTITQPPIIAYAAWQIYVKSNDRIFLEECYEPMDKFYRYLLTRDPRKNHLVGIINPDESGEDNSPRFDLALGLEARHPAEENTKKRQELFDKNRECKFDAPTCMKNFFWVKDTPYNAYLVENLECMATIAKTLNKEDGYYLEQAKLVKKAMREYMNEGGLFWSLYESDYKKIRTETWALFAPLLAKIATKKEAKHLVDNYLNNENKFASPFPIPTVSMDEASFDPNESTWGKAWQHPNWRGPVWMAPNWFVYRGLKNYGFDKEAQCIKEKSYALLEQSGFREYYHPQTGVGMGAQGFTWGGLVIDME